MTTFSNLKTYLPSALKHLFGCRVKHLWKKRNIIVTFQSGQLTEQPKTLDDLNRQTSGESASLPQYLGCKTVFDMRLRVTFLRRKTVLLQSNIAHCE